MTQLLKQAIAEIEKLSDDAQDAIAAQLLAEVADDHAWEQSFAETSDSQWDRMAAIARQEIANGNIEPLDETFPPGVSN